MSNKSILVIKLGALGDIIHSAGWFSLLRTYHANDSLSILTTPPYKDLVQRMGIFDHVFSFERFSFLNIKAWYQLHHWFNFNEFFCVYDLQGVNRTDWYKKILLPLSKKRTTQWISWEKKIRSNTHPHIRFKSILKELKNIKDNELYTSYYEFPLKRLLKWELSVKESIDSPYIILVPGSSNAHNGKKRWPYESYVELSKWMMNEGFSVVLVGTAKDHLHTLITKIKEFNPNKFYDYTSNDGCITNLAPLFANAQLAIGNDTGPMIFAGALGCKTLTLYNSSLNTGYLGGDHGHHAYYLDSDPLKILCTEKVIAHISCILNGSNTTLNLKKNIVQEDNSYNQ
jgi:ADP-heptose:LPS heptosyltransferase